MKKLLFIHFFKDTLKFFIIINLSIALIVWVIQAVNYLDFVSEDGHGLQVYFSYTLLNFPKIFQRILPFIFFISLIYQLKAYEENNELLIFWTIGINKLYFINMVILYSFLFFLFQIILTSYITPKSQDAARSVIRNSNIDFFPSLIKEGKFIDAVKNLTIFIESRDPEGNYKNIFLKELIEDGGTQETTRSQVIYAKKGILKTENNRKYLELLNGKIVNNNYTELTTFSFTKIEFNLSKFDSKSTTYPKIQELKNKTLFRCINYYSKGKKSKLIDNVLTCNKNSSTHVKEEIFKRFYKPIIIPLLALLTCLIIMIPKEHPKFNKFRIVLFLVIITVIIISEVSSRYAGQNIFGTSFFILFPLILFLMIYTYLFNRLKT